MQRHGVSLICLGYISETVRCMKLIFGRDIDRGL